MQARRLGRSNPLRIAIADDSGLIYSDDYRAGWVWGFQGIECDVKVFDVSALRRHGMTRASAYSSGSAKGYPKLMGKNIAAWKPDLVFCHHGRGTSHPAFLQEFHRLGIPSAVYLCDEPYEIGETAIYSPRFKHVFTMDPTTMEIHRMSREGRKRQVYYLPPGVNTDHFKLTPYHKRKKGGAFFLGNASLVPRPGWLKPVERALGADIRYWPKGRIAVGKGHPDWIPLNLHPSLYGDCHVGLNVHRDPGITMECYKRRILARNRNSKPVPRGLQLASRPPAHDGTGFWNDGDISASHLCPRFFEMAACGTLVVSDDTRSELERMFPMAPRADDPAHFLELCDYYLRHTDEAEAIGQACSYLISKRHSYRHRAAEVLIRVGLLEQDSDKLATLLGAPTDWLSHQLFDQPTGSSASAPTGPSERWSPAFGMSLIGGSGSVKEATSIDVPSPWLA